MTSKEERICNLLSVINDQASEITRLTGELDKRATRIASEHGGRPEWAIPNSAASQELVNRLRKELADSYDDNEELKEELAYHQEQMAKLRAII